MEFRNDQPIYLQIADHLCDQILLGRWNGGDRIPSVREVAVQIEVNPNTVMRTFTFLQEKGIIYNKRGIGYFVSDDGHERIKALRKEVFIDQELPRVFREMQLLNLSLRDIETYYKQYVRNEAGGNSVKVEREESENKNSDL